MTPAQLTRLESIYDILPHGCRAVSSGGQVTLVWLPYVVPPMWDVALTIEADGTIRHERSGATWQAAPDDPADDVIAQLLTTLERRGVRV